MFIHNTSVVDNNVSLGKNISVWHFCHIMSGSIIGDDSVLGQNVMIGNNVKIAAKSGIMKNIKDNQTVGGYPASNILDWHRNTLILKKLRKKNNDRS